MLLKDYSFSKVFFSDDEAETKESDIPEAKELPGHLFLTQTIRSGQLIKASGDITIVGDVNAGAEIIAGGNIAIFGKLRGLVHAGAFGRQDVIIIANKLMANQIRICGKIAVLPQKHKASVPEVVRLSDEGKVIISALS
ncbi:MAG: septum site-determining protein MinC [Christensenellaceae bacterium]|nr:septum site-determining protein MinC [Christensenellaceae bacterium]